MKKFFLLTMASLMAVSMMAIGGNGDSKGNAKEFDWDKGVTIPADSLNVWIWYRIPLAPLYEEENPSLTLYLTNPSNEVGTSVKVEMKAEVAGQSESKDYTIAARQYKTFTENAKMLVSLQQTEIYVQLKATGVLKFSAKVFESADLDETCKDAQKLAWYTTTTQKPMYSKWWKIDLSQIKDTAVMKKDAKVTLTNIGSKTVNLKAGQSLDCPSSGTTRRDYVLAPGESVIDTIPQNMLMSVQPDELYFGLENVESTISIRVDTIAQPKYPIIPGPSEMAAIEIKANPADTTIQGLTIPVGQNLFAFSVADFNAFAKYEPEFTYRNENSVAAHVTTKMAFERPAYGTTNTSYTIDANQEEIVVYKKNMLDGLEDVDSIFLLTSTDQPITFKARYKHVREGKACKTNIDFNWIEGHLQEARTTQWYAINIDSAREHTKDIMVYILNQGEKAATVKASMAFSCPYIDLQEISRTISKGDTIKRRLGLSTYGLMSDTVFVGLETSQDLRFWADTIDAEKKAVVDSACVKAKNFNWKEGDTISANTPTWFLIDMTEVSEQAAKFPTVFVQNMSSSAAAVITAELSYECPDSLENEKRSLTIAANDSYSKQLSRNLFENIRKNEIYLKVTSTQAISIQVRLTEEAAGASCSSAIPFNWTSGNIQAANANLWYAVDLRDVMKDNRDLVLHAENRDNAACKGTLSILFTCPSDNPSMQDFTLGAKATKTVNIKNSALDALSDSLVYIGVDASTSLRIWADTVAAKPFDTITGEGITLIPLMWDSTYTLDVDTAWYIIPEAEIAKLRNLDDKVKPVAHLINLGTAENKIKGEAAFGFPIVKEMMSKVVTLKAGQHTTDTIPLGTFEQFLKKDTILIRVTRPVGSGNFEFRAELVKAFGGNRPEDAIPFIIPVNTPTKSITFTQNAAQGEMWYKVKTADLKKDTTLFNKILRVAAKNAGKGATKVKVRVFDGLKKAKEGKKEDDLLMGRGEKTIDKGLSKAHNVPAQAVYGVGDVELYIGLTTTDSIVLDLKIVGEYAPQAVDPDQANAKLLVPNVDYVIPGDNQPHWYQVCLPYMQNNFKYTDAACLTYELNGQATIEGTATFEEPMTCAMPVRKRTINRSGKHYKGTKLLREIIEEVADTLGYKISLEDTKPSYIDSMLHRFVTKDSVTFFVRVQTDNEIKFNLQLVQKTGDACLNPMEFDWEHGNVSEAGRTNIIHVSMDSTRVPVGKDLKLHMDNWGTDSTYVSATFYEEGCPLGTKLGSVGRKILNDTTKVIAREILSTWKWAGLIIQYQSDSTTHIWAELIDQLPPVPLRDTTWYHVCAGADTLGYTIYKDTALITTKDSIDKSEMIYYIYTHVDTIITYREIELIEIDSLENIPVVTKGGVLDCSLATAELDSIFKARGDSTVKPVINIKWEYTDDGVNYKAVPTTAMDTDVIALRYVLTVTCNDNDTTSNPKVYIPVYEDKVESCKSSYTWPYNGKTYTEPNNTDTVHVPVGLALLEKALQLNLTFKLVEGQEDVESACGTYTWNGKDYTQSGNYVDTIPTADNQCDSIAKLNLTINTTAYDTTKVGYTGDKPCNFYKWAKNDKYYYETGMYNDTVKATSPSECDSIFTLDVVIDNPIVFNLKAVSRYGNRLLIINRWDIIDNIGWQLDSIYDANGPVKVYWYKTDGTTNTKVGEGYYYNNANGDPLVGTFFAYVEVPAATGNCGYKGYTQKLVCEAPASAAPALIPNLVRGGENIRVVNLDPEKETTIRVYTTEGLVKETYTVRGENSFTIKAAVEYGFYLVELSNDDLHSTLRYIVK